MAGQVIIVDVRGMPEVIYDVRREVARILTDIALDEKPEVAARLLEIAATFEVGVHA